MFPCALSCRHAQVREATGLNLRPSETSMKPPGCKKCMEEFYHFETFAAEHWVEILAVGIALIFVLFQVTRQK